MAALKAFSTFSVLRSAAAESIAKESASHDPEKWKKLFIFVCCPAIALSFINICISEHKPRTEFKKYPYLRIRNSRYPWRDGVKTLFHNPKTNALPDGYEE